LVPRAGSAMRGGLAHVVVAIVVAVVLVLARQARLHGVDSDYLVQQLQAGDLQQYRRHVLFMPIAGQVFAWLQPFGISAFVTLQLISAIGTALGVAATQRAATIFIAGTPALRGRVGPTAVAIAVAVAPALVYYGTAAELHGCFFAGVGLAWWAFARWWLAPSFARALLIGAAAGLATSLHACGIVLPGGFMLAAMALGRRNLGMQLQLMGGALLLAPVVMLAAALGAGCEAAAPMGESVQWLQLWGLRIVVPNWPAVIAQEWLWPFAPWSLLSLLGLAAARSRPWALASLGVVCVHLPIALVLLARDPPVVELGAYLLPVALPVALAAAALLPRWGFMLATATAFACSIALLWPRWQPVYDDDFVAGIESLRAEQTFSLLVDQRELEAVRIEFTDVICIEVLRSIGAFDGGRVSSREELGQLFAASVALFARTGAPLLVTDAAANVLATAPDPRLQWLSQQFGSAQFAQKRVERAGLAGVMLTPR
jgi:hypothetical protein